MAVTLILGRSGQLARAVHKAAQGRADKVVAAGRERADLARRGEVSRLIRDLKPDIVINAAAFTAVDAAETQQRAALAINAEGAEEAAAAACKVGARYVLVSTDYVFGANSETGPFAETAPTAPINVYGWTKRDGELRTLATDPAAAIVRTSALFSGSGADFPSAMWRLAADTGVLRVVEDQLTTPTFVDELAIRLVLIASNRAAVGIFHGVGAPDVCWADFAEAALAVSRANGGPDARVERISSRDFHRPAPRPADSRLCGSRFEGATGLAPPDWRNGLEAAFNVWRARAPA